MKYARLTLSLIAAGLLAACSSAPAPTAGRRRRRPLQRRRLRRRRQRRHHRQCRRRTGRAYPELKDPKNILSKRSVLFDYDSYVIKDQYRPLVEAHAKFLVSHPRSRC
jgi:peptidoglycan-associated lipoprotein